MLSARCLRDIDKYRFPFFSALHIFFSSTVVIGTYFSCRAHALHLALPSFSCSPEFRLIATAPTLRLVSFSFTLRLFRCYCFRLDISPGAAFFSAFICFLHWDASSLVFAAAFSPPFLSIDAAFPIFAPLFITGFFCAICLSLSSSLHFCAAFVVIDLSLRFLQSLLSLLRSSSSQPRFHDAWLFEFWDVYFSSFTFEIFLI